MCMDGFDGEARNWRESIDDVQGDDGNANALLGSVPFAKLHVYRAADGER